MLPPEFRDLVRQKDEGGNLVLTTYDGCIVGFPLPEWEEFEAKLSAVPNPVPLVRIFRRLVLGGAEMMPIDSQGRVRLSREHMNYAKIDKDVLVVGIGPRFEIWAPELFASNIEQNFDDVAEAISDTGISFAF